MPVVAEMGEDTVRWGWVDCHPILENGMLYRFLTSAAVFCCTVGMAFAEIEPRDQPSSLTQLHTDVSAAKRSKSRANAEYAPAYQPRQMRTSADPSVGPDGKPYRVPEYLRNQCYFDDGYGRFVACSNR